VSGLIEQPLPGEKLGEDAPSFADLLARGGGERTLARVKLLAVSRRAAPGDRGQGEPPEGDPSSGGPLAVTVGVSSRAIDLRIDGPGLPPEAARALAAVLRDAVRHRQREVQLQLRPAELGGLTIRIGLEGDRTVNLEAVTSDPRVAERLLLGREELARSLARWGLDLRRFAVRTHEQGSATARPEVQDNRSAGSGEPADSTRRSFFEVVI
jgi:hypothetical protein